MKDDAPAASDVATALLREARHELAEHGAGGVSLRAVARRAGVSHAAPKHHFGDRAGLLTAVAVDGFERLTEALLRADTATPTRSTGSPRWAAPISTSASRTRRCSS